MNAHRSPGATPKLRLAVVTNIPAPYRVPVYNLLARLPGIELHAFYAARSEADRQWDLPPFAHAHTFMPGRVVQRNGRYIHHTPNVGRHLAGFAPDVVLTTGYNPTHLAAWWHATVRRKPHVVMTDGTDVSEAALGLAHRTVRRMVYATSRSFVVASAGGHRLLRGYGVRDDRIHVSPLCANAAVDWSAPAGHVRDIDLLFSGRLVPVKNATYALQVAAASARGLGRRLRLALLGSGPEEAALRQQAQTLADDVEVLFAGHVSQADIPHWFLRSRLFLFPTRWDPWGVVANEACMAGLPVLVSPHAGVAGELVRDGINGRVLPLDEAAAWVQACVTLLGDDAVLQRQSDAAMQSVAPYNFDNAAQGMADAALQAAARYPGLPRRPTYA